MTIRLDYAVPPADLAPFVSLFYRFEANVPVFEDLERADRAQLRFRLSAGRASYRFATGGERPAPANHFLGATRGATLTRAEGPVLVFGMGLTPCGWAAMLGLDASAAGSRLVDADRVIGREAVRTADALREAGELSAMVAAAASLLRGRLARADEEVVGFCRSVDDWLSGAVSPALPALLSATGLTLRQAERRCKQLYGAPPKVLARKYRALRAAAAIAAHDAACDVIVAEGFYDQSHLIRELKQFTGRTPGQIRSNPGRLAALTFGQRRALDGAVPPMISRT